MMLSWCHRSGGQHQQFRPPPAPHAASHSGTERRGAPAIVRAALGTRMPRRVGSRWVRSGMPCVGLRRGTRAGDELTTAPWGSMSHTYVLCSEYAGCQRPSRPPVLRRAKPLSDGAAYDGAACGLSVGAAIAWGAASFGGSRPAGVGTCRSSASPSRASHDRQTD